MIISKIERENFIYLNLHAEEVITSNFIEDDNGGIFGDRLQIVTVNRVVNSLDTEGIKNIILDFKYINACQPNLNKIIFDLKNKGFRLLFLNIRKAVCEDLALTSISNENNVQVGEIYPKYFFFEDVSEDLINITIDVAELFKETFKNKLKPFIDAHDRPHTSSYVYLVSYVDIKKFFSHEKEFMLYSLYKLAIKIKTEWSEEIDKKPILVCQSMNSAYIVSVLSNLLKLDILILDKIGPINKLYNRIDNHISGDRKYIIVSDLVCLGTEVKIVKNLIQFIGGQYLGNVSLIKVETLSKSDITRVDSTKAIFSINKSNNKELNYNITTDLEQF